MSEQSLESPRKPENISIYATACLDALSEAGLGNLLSIGGAFGLLHYWDYRSTHDVDGWWKAESSAQEREAVVALLESTLARYGEVRTRRWGEVVSVELRENARTVFSFQIAERSAQLEESVAAGWMGVPIDSLSDLIAGKMNALVERGAPRDFRDIYTVCQAGLVSPKRCWELWRQRQLLASGDADMKRANLAVTTHLERIEHSRPLERITDSGQRAEAEQVRKWFREEFARVRLD